MTKQPLALVGLALLALATGTAREARAQEPPPASTPIEHLVVLMQENHSFDNYFGTFPGADGIPEGTCMPVAPGSADCVRPFHIGDNDVQQADLDHSAATHRLQHNDGAMDGFVHALNLRNQDGRLAMGYYDERDLPYHWKLAREFVLFDRFFSSASGGSTVNHMYWVAGAPGQGGDGLKSEAQNDVPTIFDRLQERGVTWKFYIQNYRRGLNYRTAHEYPANDASQVVWAPLLMMDRFIDDPELSSHIVDLEEYYGDLANGTLPAVSYIVPSGASEHPPASLRAGQRFVKGLVDALMTSDAWWNSALLVAYDDWGGWHDHVAPPQVDEFGYGFRVPAFMVSPYARSGYISHTELDFTSVLKFIEDNYDIEPLADRDARANSFVDAFDFAQVPREPAFISPRPAEAPAHTPNRNVVLVLYGGAIALAAVVAAGAIVRPRRGRFAR